MKKIKFQVFHQIDLSGDSWKTANKESSEDFLNSYYFLWECGKCNRKVWVLFACFLVILVKSLNFSGIKFL